jgi:glutamyl-tRNA synthetase
MTLLNSNYEDWHAQNPDKKYTDFPFSLKKMSSSGCLYDINKLTDVSKNVISRMDADTVYERLVDWAQEFDVEFATLLKANEEMSKQVLAIGRGGKKPRKDLAKWSDAKDYMGFFFAPLFEIKEEYPENFKREDIKRALELFKASYDYSDDMNAWFEKVKTVATEIGYAADMKEFKANPEAFGGNVADVSMFIRVAVTGKTNAPDLYTVMQILGKDETLARIDAMIAKI